MQEKKRILIVGGVAGGASCAARARRMSETAEIIMFDRGPYVSFANCGLPYYVGNIIKKEENLLIATPELFRKRFNIEVRLQSEVIDIDSARQSIQVKDLTTGEQYSESYDVLVLSPGAVPIRPNLPGIDLEGIFSLRTIPDSRMIRDWISRHQARHALVVGGGYIGMEMTENLHKRGLKVTVVEKMDQVMPVVDPEMMAPIHQMLVKKGVDLRLRCGVNRFDKNGDGHTLFATLDTGERIEADLVILCIGVRPHVDLALKAGIQIGKTGGIQVNARMQTSNPHIMAVGDAVEVQDVVTDTLSQDVDTLLKLNLSWTKYFPACSSQPWQVAIR